LGVTVFSLGIISAGDIVIYSVLVSVIAYLIGSISSAVIISKKFFKTDIRNHGSGNAGATNVLRIFGKKAGALVFIFDFSKGLLSVLFARCLFLLSDAPYECVLLAGFFAQLGHTFPFFFKFRGG
jgi:glycerol-3-phosphate acyltransferase PlsY